MYIDKEFTLNYWLKKLFKLNQTQQQQSLIKQICVYEIHMYSSDSLFWLDELRSKSFKYKPAIRFRI